MSRPIVSLCYYLKDYRPNKTVSYKIFQINVSKNLQKLKDGFFKET